jgi:Holliday junction resolvase
MKNRCFCDKCGSKKIMKEKEPVCPTCNNLNFIAHDKAINIYEQLYSWFNSQFRVMIGTLDKTELIFWLLEERTLLTSRFMHESPSLNLIRLFTLNDLLKKVFEVYNVKGTEKTDYEKVMQLIDLYSFFIEYIVINRSLVEEGYAHCILKKPIDLQRIKHPQLLINELISSFSCYYDVDLININKSLGLNMILSNEDTGKYLHKHKDEYDKINKNTRKKTKYALKETIQKLYPTINSLYNSLIICAPFGELYDISYLEEKKIPLEVFSTIAECPMNRLDILMYTNKDEFLKYITESIRNCSPEKIYKNLVFSENNQDIFPLMVEINEQIFISPSFMDLMKLYYIPIHEKKLFDKETQKRSTPFEEEEVPNKLRQNGFEVINDKKDGKKNKLQIDSIARKGNKIYVIETKLWDIKKLFMHKKTHYYRERDIKGIVNGAKFSNGKTVTIPSLIKKIEYVKENLESLFQNHEKIDSIEGLIITRSYPPITEYKGVKVISLEEITNL